MKITLSEQSRRTLHWSAWLAAAIIALHAVPITAMALLARYDADDQATYKSIYIDQINGAALIILAALLVAILAIFALKKSLPVQRLPKLTPKNKRLARTIILATIVGAAPAATMIFLENIASNSNDQYLAFAAALLPIHISTTLLTTSFFGTIALCVMALKRNVAQKVTDYAQFTLTLLAAAGMIVLALVISKIAVGDYRDATLFHDLKIYSIPIDVFIEWTSMLSTACIGALIICALGKLIITYIAKPSRIFGTYRIAQAIYVVAAIVSVRWLSLNLTPIIAFAGASIVLFFSFTAFKTVTPRNTIYNRLATVLNLITPIFLAIPMFAIGGALVPITVARFCNRRALQQDSNDQFAKACLAANSWYIALCIIMPFIRIGSIMLHG